MKTIIELFAIQLTPVSFHIGLTTRTGRKKTRWIVDTGASQTVISSHLVEDLKLETEMPEVNNITVGIGQGTLKPELTFLKTMTIGPVKIKNMACIVLPMDHINTTYKSIGQKSIDGIIGNDLLFALKCKIDMAKLTMIITTDKKVYDFEKLYESMGLSIQ
jgi:hypothetical protein